MWARLKGKIVTVGISDYAQDQLGQVKYLDLPEPGQEVIAGEEMGAVESAKSVSDLISPVTGEVAAVNLELEGDPALVNQDPYGDGWIAKIVLEDLDQVEALLEAGEYEASLG
ncbi:MAG: glycine cleavage system protein GcvH [Desulfarculus sp.]|nr:MAG: glycine cleavage system protein GcvH [Desulfarculus sp.]